MQRLFAFFIVIDLIIVCMQAPLTETNQKRYDELKQAIDTTIANKLPLYECRNYRNPLLVIAAQRNFNPLVAKLLAHGADPNAIGPIAIPAFNYAVKNLNISMMLLLLSYGARHDIKYPEPLGYIPTSVLFDELKQTDERYTKNCLYMLLFYGVDDYLGSHPVEKLELLHRAAWNEYEQCANVLCKYGKNKKQLLDYVKNKNYDRVKNLASAFTVMVRDEWGNNPLHYALKNDDLEMSGLLLLINKQLLFENNNHGFTPLCYALGSGRYEVLKRVLGLTVNTAVVD